MKIKIKTMTNKVDQQWASSNFCMIYNYGNLFEVEYSERDLDTVKKLFSKKIDVHKLKDIKDGKYIFPAMASLINNLKKEIEVLSTREKNDIGEAIRTMQDIIIAKDKIDEVVFYSGKKRFTIKNKQIVDSILSNVNKSYPTLEHHGHVIADNLKTYNSEKRGIPYTAKKVAAQLNFTLKALSPGITTGSIIKKVFQSVGLDDYDDIRQINNLIKLGEKLS